MMVRQCITFHMVNITGRLFVINEYINQTMQFHLSLFTLKGSNHSGIAIIPLPRIAYPNLITCFIRVVVAILWGIFLVSYLSSNLIVMVSINQMLNKWGCIRRGSLSEVSGCLIYLSCSTRRNTVSTRYVIIFRDDKGGSSSSLNRNTEINVEG
ncbi:hypothetical protein BVZ25_20160 [Klebsiella quasipneumoniae]|nr:hypothetical protein BVZ25_20160 [Klebsiella quasipneumoniae]